jgi:hypothetical protein
MAERHERLEVFLRRLPGHLFTVRACILYAEAYYGGRWALVRHLVADRLGSHWRFFVMDLQRLLLHPLGFHFRTLPDATGASTRCWVCELDEDDAEDYSEIDHG